jgi:outer membrane lipoprotein-sorting protein
MTKRMGFIGVAGAVLGLGAVLASAEDLDAVQKKIVDAWSKQKSLTAKLTTATQVDLGGGTSMSGTGQGTYEFLKQGGKLLSRLELKTTIVQKQGAEENRMEQQMLMVSDGEIAHTLTEAFGEQRAMKSRVPAGQTGEPKALIEQLRQQGEVKALPEGTVDGRKVYVLEVTPKKVIPGAPAKQILFFDQESGFMIKIEGRGDNDLLLTSMTYGDIKLDQPIDPDHFKFKLPEGVEMIDDTASAPAASQPASAPKP